MSSPNSKLPHTGFILTDSESNEIWALFGVVVIVKSNLFTWCLVPGSRLDEPALSSTWSRSLAMQGSRNTHRRSYRAAPPEKLGFLFAYPSTWSSFLTHWPHWQDIISTSTTENVLRSVNESWFFFQLRQKNDSELFHMTNCVNY